MPYITLLVDMCVSVNDMYMYVYIRMYNNSPLNVYMYTEVAWDEAAHILTHIHYGFDQVPWDSPFTLPSISGFEYVMGEGILA